MSYNIIYVMQKQHIFNKALKTRLQEADITVLPLPDDIDEIYRHRNDADIFLFNAEEDNAQTSRIVKYIADICRDSRKSFCLIGGENFLANFKNSPTSKQITQTYIAPVNADDLITDMVFFAQMHEEFRRKKDILIVDDDNDFLMIIQRWLRHSYTVTGVHSGAEALQKISEESFDLILLDYEMPEMDGYEVMSKIHQNPATSNIPIIFLTGLNDRENVMRIIKHRPDGYILKSTKKLELLDTLERFFAESIFGKK